MLTYLILAQQLQGDTMTGVESHQSTSHPAILRRHWPCSTFQSDVVVYFIRSLRATKNIMGLSTMVLTLPALGQDVQLGMLYDIRTAQFFSGVSLWSNSIVNARQTLDDHVVQNTEFTYSNSLEQARSHVALDVEGSLSLDLGIIKATGSAKYLNDKQSSSFEARIDVSCTVVRRTRRIPQEILGSMQYERNLDDPRFTHFVAEVVEGGSATLSFVQSCSSSEEAKKVTGRLEAKITKLPIRGKAKVEFSEESKSVFESLKISYSGAIAENVSNVEEACRVAREMPTKLGQQFNTLSYKLLPLTVLRSTVNREIRHLDANLVVKTAEALKAGTVAGLKLKDVMEQDGLNTPVNTVLFKGYFIFIS
ncbi:hypothetical protein GGS23DRAFT_564932 [Durotheca rogersii]|uniref:uncharacterized protein n=1 Tax=Durotheca rogersii TaxID=419775 RepID=UPI00221E4B5E|nr:uncharacterized protein GGS23DRAFT_564932 [Durotheca rogersii]KAI5863678.1 hypothetical protein GGS23DRAFT_564932 [Durotheca rogersii]